MPSSSKSSGSPSTGSDGAKTGKQPTIRVIVAVSAELERVAWGIVISGQPDMQLVGEAATCEEALTMLRAIGSDVTLIDDVILRPDHHERFLNYSHLSSASRIVLVVSHDLESPLTQSRYGFARAYVLKGVRADELLSAIRDSVRARASPADAD